MNNGLTLWRDMDRIFDDFLTPIHANVRSNSFAPACDVHETEEHYLMSFDLPGISKDEINIQVVENELTISGERRKEWKEAKQGTSWSERSYGKFTRTFTLPTSVDADKIEAHFENGVLRLVLPKAAAVKPRQIRISDNTNTSGFFSKLLGQSRKPDEKEVSSRQKDNVA